MAGQPRLLFHGSLLLDVCMPSRTGSGPSLSCLAVSGRASPAPTRQHVLLPECLLHSLWPLPLMLRPEDSSTPTCACLPCLPFSAQ